MKDLPKQFKGKPLVWAWPYRRADGEVFGWVGRYQRNSEKKDIVPFFTRDGSGWKFGAAPDPRPLFGLDYLAAMAERRAVLVPEGEKCAAALQSLGLCAVASQGGSGAAGKADWGPLSGFATALLLPDHDEPGESYARAVCAALSALDAPPALFLVRLPELPDGGDVVDWLQARCPGWNGFDPVPESERERLSEDLNAMLRELAEPPPVEWTAPATGNDWPAPIPLDAAALPEWPGDVFPETVQAFVSGLAEATETPPELPALFALAALSTAAHGKYQVWVKPDYFEPVNVWTCPALVPGSRKSAVKSVVTAPLLAWELTQRATLESAIKEAESKHATITERVGQLRKTAAKAKTTFDFERMKDEIAALEATLPDIPRPPQLWTDNCTPERLGTLMAENAERIGILSDEAEVFEQMGGRYSGGIPNLDVFLQGHAGTPVRVDRGSRPSVFLQRPSLTIGISPQPDVLRGLTTKPGFRGRGLLGRFLYALPASNLGKRSGETRPLSEDLKLRWAGHLHMILNAEPATDRNGEACPHTLKLSPAAFEAWQAFWLQTEASMGPGGKFEHCTDWAGKLPGAVARVAGLLHITRHAFRGPEKHEISADDLHAALRMADALSAHALAAFDLMGADPALDGARVVLGWIRREGLKSFTFRDCHYAHKARFKRANDLEPAMDVLTERHYIRPLVPETKPAYRPSRTFEVNPAIFGGGL